MKVNFKIKRTSPNADGAGVPEDFDVELAEGATVLDGLLEIRDNYDPTIAFQADCTRGFCGSCAFRVNGEGILACVKRVSEVAKDATVSVEPIREVGVVKDLVYDLDTFLWEKVRAVQPGIVSDDEAVLEETRVDPAAMEELQDVMSCVMCGLCDEGCTVIAVDKTFLGPAALTKAYRAVRDPRDTQQAQRLSLVDKDHGIWDCTHCFEANGHCPKGINPTNRIFTMRDMLIRHGIKNKGVKRHHDSFVSSVRSSGWLDEGRIAIDSLGWTNLIGLIRFIPTAFRALRRGKAPIPYVHHKRPGAEHIRRIMEKVERGKE